jgi:hypothetical protein
MAYGSRRLVFKFYEDFPERIGPDVFGAVRFRDSRVAWAIGYDLIALDFEGEGTTFFELNRVQEFSIRATDLKGRSLDHAYGVIEFMRVPISLFPWFQVEVPNYNSIILKYFFCTYSSHRIDCLSECPVIGNCFSLFRLPIFEFFQMKHLRIYLLALLTLALASEMSFGQDTKANIVLVMADDQGYSGDQSEKQ